MQSKNLSSQSFYTSKYFILNCNIHDLRDKVLNLKSFFIIKSQVDLFDA